MPRIERQPTAASRDRTQTLFDHLLQPHLDDLRKYCFYLAKSKWDGEDLCQETLVKTMQYFAKVEPLQNSVKPFLFRVARNLWIDQYRAYKKKGELVLFDADLANPTFDADYGEIRSWAERFAETIPRRNIAIWLLCDYYGYSMQEIAVDMRCTVSIVKSVLFRTRKRIRELANRPVSRQAGQETGPFAERLSRAILTDNPQWLMA
ncbi:RNA polymerase sigma factor [Cohnella suwonensis]|uniref:RNA polymerase sigma factor n=1 Tax=Cohnella suwonensis TaxID=696072 RepID=A0ABW0LWH7_9BACL